MAPKLLSITAAAAALEPHVAPISAINVLNDWRRSEQHYKPLSNYIPRFVRIDGRVFYPEEEIDRIIVGVQVHKARYSGT